MFEKYLIDLPDAQKYIVCQFRTVNHRNRSLFQEMKGYVKCVIGVSWGTNSTFVWNVPP